MRKGIHDKLVEECDGEDIPDFFAMTFCHTVQPSLLKGMPCLMSLAISRLTKKFGVVPDVLNDPVKLAAFCALPVEAVQDWLDLPMLEAHSENCVLLLLNAWVVNTDDDLSAPQLLALAGQVRVQYLSSGFALTVLPTMEWFWGCSVENVRATQRNLNIILALKQFGPGLSAAWDGPEGWVKYRREYVVSRNNELSWGLDAGEILALKQDKNVTMTSPGAVYVNGYHVRLVVCMPGGSELRFGMMQDRLLSSDIVATVGIAKVYGEWDDLDPDLDRKVIVVGSRTLLRGNNITWTVGSFALGALPRLQSGIRLKLNVASVE